MHSPLVIIINKHDSLDLARILERDLTRVGEEEREDGGAGD